MIDAMLDTHRAGEAFKLREFPERGFGRFHEQRFRRIALRDGGCDAGGPTAPGLPPGSRPRVGFDLPPAPSALALAG